MLNFVYVTGNREVLNVVNCYEQCISYTTTEEIETELTFNACEPSRMLPDGMQRRSDLHTGVAFDNFDLFVETLTGKNTLHDTVGIGMQDIPDNDEDLFNEQDETEGYEEDDIVPPKRRRRTYDVINETMEPYHKKTKILTESMVALEDQRRALIPGSLQTARKLDLIWMASLNMEVPNIPMWTGWHSLSTPKDSLLSPSTASSLPAPD